MDVYVVIHVLISNEYFLSPLTGLVRCSSPSSSAFLAAAAANSPRPMPPQPALSSWRTMNEAELSESLVYLTCPICEKVLQNDPVSTPCHHKCKSLLDGR